MLNKIMVVGCCGSGKSTLSKKIQEKTGLPLIHLDKEYYKPNWEEPTKDEWYKKGSEFSKADEWIIDGNYISSMHIRLAEADTVVLLDMNRGKCLLRAVIRETLPSKKHRYDMADGCNERHDLNFYKFIWDFNKTTRPRIYQLLEQNQDVNLYVLRNSTDIKSFMEKL